MSFKSSLSSQAIEDILVNAMTKNNAEEYTPAGDYNPATKKYVDENAGKQIIMIPTDGSSNSHQSSVTLNSLGSDASYNINTEYNESSTATGEAIKYAMSFQDGPVFHEGIIEKGTQRSVSVVTTMPGTKDLVTVSFVISSALENNTIVLGSLTCKYIQRTVTEEQYGEGGYNDDIIYYVVPNAQ